MEFVANQGQNYVEFVANQGQNCVEFVANQGQGNVACFLSMSVIGQVAVLDSIMDEIIRSLNSPSKIMTPPVTVFLV